MTTVRIGMVEYINTAPIYEEWKSRIIPADWQVTEAPPSTLNRLLAGNRIDLGYVSSHEYAVRPEMYRILADLSISATGPVGSVFLFSSLPPEELSGKPVLLTGQSQTSVALVKIVLEEFCKVQPRYRVGEVYVNGQCARDVSAVLAIGDEALRLHAEGMHPYQLDLADIWYRATGLPFVFAVFAVREEFVRDHPATLRQVWETLIDCRDRGRKRLAEISRLVAPRVPMDETACHDYLSKIEHHLSPVHQKGLELFFSYLVRRVEAPGNALPLKFFP
ncbi:MAG TPA: ABC transporter substrate-binding protein [Desulfobulbaceae bacterium]|nr:ABC transporter substrate-binding protein [Desulfobulbaceae bacterium]